MPLDPRKLMALAIPDRQAGYAARDTMLYALAVGMGAGDLPFVYEGAGPKVVPSMATMLSFDDSWLEAGGVDLRHVVHGALDLSFAAPLAAEGAVTAATSLVGLDDKGPGRGGLVFQETRLVQDGVLACSVLSTMFVRGAGGFGGPEGVQAIAAPIPDGPPAETLDITTTENQALIFRLLGDRNPLHADPAVATAAGFPRPILHGACTFGIACATVLRHFAGGDPARLTRFAARFAGPLFPGETLRFAFWPGAEGIGFRAFAVERDAIVLDNGLAVLAA